METILFTTTLVCSIYTGIALLGEIKRRFPVLTLSISILLIGCLVTEFLFPHLLFLFERDSALIYTGQWWRLMTALFFQDGWLAGGTFNILFFILIGSISEQLFSKRDWVIIYFGAGLITELVALTLQPVGAGNSIAIFGLAGAIAMNAFLRFHHNWKILFPIFSSFITLLLLIQNDIHGCAFVVGALLYGLINWLWVCVEKIRQ